MVVGERLEQQRVHYTEDRGVRAMPSASDRIATAVNPGLLSIARIAYRRSCSNLSIIHLLARALTRSLGAQHLACDGSALRKRKTVSRNDAGWVAPLQQRSQLACQARSFRSNVSYARIRSREGGRGRAAAVHSWESAFAEAVINFVERARKGRPDIALVTESWECPRTIAPSEQTFLSSKTHSMHG